MKKTILLLLILTQIACKTGINRSFSNDGIDSRILKEVNALEEQYIVNLKKGKRDAIKSIMSEILINQSKEKADGFIDQLAQIIKNETSEIIDQYHIQNSTGQLATRLFSTVNDDSGYEIKVKPMNKEAFLSIRKVNTFPYQYLMMNLYSKYNQDWKLDMIKIHEYAAHNLNAYDLYKEAEYKLGQDNLLAASNLIILSSQLSRPGGNIFAYKKHDKMGKLYDEIINKANEVYKFPIQMNSINSQPKLLSYTPLVLNEGIIPSISYLSNIPISDSIELKNENEAIHNNIQSIFNKINTESSHIIYQAMNEIPNGTKGVNTYTFSKKNIEY